jgi:hypothetical protein
MTYTFFRRRLLTQHRQILLVVVGHPRLPLKCSIGMNQKMLHYRYVKGAKIGEQE